MLPFPSPQRHALLGLSLAVGLPGCGQYISADAALSQTAAPVTLASPAELSEARVLLHYALESLLQLHTEELAWGGGEARHLDYGAFLDQPEARVSLAQALEQLSAVDLEVLETPAERQAFAYNLYNGWMLAAAIEAQQLDPAWPGVAADAFEVFHRPFIPVNQAGDEGMVISLDQLEQGILRGQSDVLDSMERPAIARRWHAAVWEGPLDPRLHVALNCASRSCPDLPAGAWQATTLDAELDAAATRFLAHPGKGAGPAGISALFVWYAEDFAAGGGVADFIAQHRSGGTSGVSLDETLVYDWELNGL